MLVVTDDHVLARAMRDLGADVIPDGTSDLNGALVQAAAEMQRRRAGLRLAAVCADLPALRPAELTTALGLVGTERHVLRRRRRAASVRRRDGRRPRRRSARRSGPARAREHLARGAHELEPVDVPGLRRDVDDPDDLVEALALGVGPRTSLVATGLRLAR